MNQRERKKSHEKSPKKKVQRKKSHDKSPMIKDHHVKSYNVIEIPDFLTHEECDLLIQISKTVGLEKSLTVDGLNLKHRTSDTVWLKDNDDIVQQISKKVSVLTNTPITHQELIQVVHYNTGGKFKPHYDADNTSSNGTSDRLSTFLIYLNDGYKGGDTTFPVINKSIVPKKGKAIYFYNLDKKNNKLIYEALHQGSPVTEGEKWIANKWIHVSPVYM